tara:strand:- start:1529 stop:2215 length:687 start_codon:yes stop_codon:yes gene_type:complete
LNLEDNLNLVKKNIELAKQRVGLTNHVEIIAATKTRDLSTIEKCVDLGITTIGENRIQEAEKKFSNFPGFGRIKKRFIGHLQRNKVNKCLELFDTIDSVDSYKLAKKINNTSKKNGVTTECLLEINTSSEPQKWGFLPQVSEDILSCFQLNNIKVVGLMTIGPNTKNQKDIRKSFVLLRRLQNRINKTLGENHLRQLSMGMTGDYEIGVEEGSTMIRVGTGLFGQRSG